MLGRRYDGIPFQDDSRNFSAREVAHQEEIATIRPVDFFFEHGNFHNQTSR